MKAKCTALLVGMILLGPSRAGATPITYAVSEFESAGNSIPTSLGVGIGGSITTDGTLGPIGAANIVDWSLIGTADNFGGVAIAQFLLNPSNSDLSNIVNVTATANALTLGVGSGVIIPNGDFLSRALHLEALSHRP